MSSDPSQAPHHDAPTYGNPDQPAQGSINTRDSPQSGRMYGARNTIIESQFPSQMDAPATDVSTQPFFWSSFNISARRQQRGG